MSADNHSTPHPQGGTPAATPPQSGRRSAVLQGGAQPGSGQENAVQPTSAPQQNSGNSTGLKSVGTLTAPVLQQGGVQQIAATPPQSGRRSAVPQGGAQPGSRQENAAQQDEAAPRSPQNSGGDGAGGKSAEPCLTQQNTRPSAAQAVGVDAIAPQAARSSAVQAVGADPTAPQAARNSAAQVKTAVVAFFGSDAIALPLLHWLHENGGEGKGFVLSCVVSQPDRKSGRGQKLQPNPIAAYAQEAGIPLLQPEKPDAELEAQLAAADVQLALVMAYGHLLKKALLALPRLGFVNFHASLLPKYRGASPVETAVACGETQTGVSLMRIIPRMDAGPVLDAEAVAIDHARAETGADIREKLAAACVPLIARNMAVLLGGAAAAPLPETAEAAGTANATGLTAASNTPLPAGNHTGEGAMADSQGRKPADGTCKNTDEAACQSAPEGVTIQDVHHCASARDGETNSSIPAFIPQDESRASYCRKLEKSDGQLDFTAPARVLAARINGLFPWPGCFFDYNGERIKAAEAFACANGDAAETHSGTECRTDGDIPENTPITTKTTASRTTDGRATSAAAPQPLTPDIASGATTTAKEHGNGTALPDSKETAAGGSIPAVSQTNPATYQTDPTTAGTILAADKDGLRIATGDGVLCIRRLQRPGGKMLPVREFISGMPLQIGGCVSGGAMRPLTNASPRWET